MKKPIYPTSLIGAALLVAGCCSCPRSSPPATQAAAHPVIVRLISRHQTLTITAGPRAPLYSITDSQGQLVLAPATLDEIAVSDPAFYRYLRDALATDASASRP